MFMKVFKLKKMILIIFTICIFCVNVAAEVENKTAKSVYDKVYIKSSSNEWKPEEMKLISDNTWYIRITFGNSTTERFKFDIYGNWILNFGDNNNDGVCEQNGKDILVDSGKTYDITFNDETKKYIKKEVVIFKVQDERNFGKRSNISIQLKIKDGNLQEFTDFIRKNSGYIKIKKEGIPMGLNLVPDDSGKLKMTNMVLGKYTVSINAPINSKLYFGEKIFNVDGKNSEFEDIFDLEIQDKGKYKQNYPSMYIRGTFNDWKITPMKLIENNVWSIQGIKTGNSATERFKLDVNGDWTINFGKNGIQSGEEIFLDANSEYEISFNEISRELKIIKRALSVTGGTALP